MPSPKVEQKLPDYYECVARDVVEMCKPRDGVWVDLGCGEGAVAFALAELSRAVLVLVDPNREALAEALRRARDMGLSQRTVALCGRAESLPLVDDSVDLVVSRGSIFFWDDRPAGVREVYRALRPGGKAMLGGGLGRSYPLWARREFISRRREGVRQEGPAAVRAFAEVRSRDAFQGWAEEAGLHSFEVIGEAALPEDDPNTGLGLWLIFEKEQEQP
ncbi:MAG: class I SAM-dependent methyltransferase [Planctomycetes bacterium]|nr:class I SAM-dependent methyltransferase [Planctomycetota bacterium]